MAKKDNKDQTEDLSSEDQDIDPANEELLEEDATDIDYDNEHDVENTTLSARILKALTILVIGGVIALWGAPKLAPILPSGLKPVANFLAPQSDNNAQIEALKVEFEAQIKELAAKDVSKELKPILDALSSTDADISTALKSLEDEVQNLQSSISAIEADLTKLNARQALSGQDGTLSAEALKALEQKLEAITSAQQALSQNQTSAIEAQEDAESKLRLSGATAAISMVSNALNSGEGFSDQANILANTSGVVLPDALMKVAESGVIPHSALRKQFPNLARRALRDEAAARSDTSMLGKFSAFVQSQVGTRSLEPRTGDDLDAILSRIASAMDDTDLNAALSEAEQLNEPAAEVFNSWVASLSDLVAAKSALDAVENQLQTVQN